MRWIDVSRLKAYQAILRLPTDPLIVGKFGHQRTQPLPQATQRAEHYQRRVMTYLMYRDLDRYGDL